MEKNKAKAMDYEDRDIPIKAIGIWVGSLFGGLLAVMLVCHILYGFRPQITDGKNVLTRPMNQPALQPRPPEQLKVFLAEEEATLTTYGWINKAAGTVRIPIEHAMDLVLQKGLPARGGR